MTQLTFDPHIPLALWVPLSLTAVGLLVWYAMAARGRLAPRRWPLVVSLMTVAVLVPLAILLNPTWLERIEPPAGKPLLTILVDRSASMATRDSGEGTSRFESAAGIAVETVNRLTEKYDVRVRTFADESSAAVPQQLREMTPDGATTDLAAAIDNALEDDRPQGQAMLLLSDGGHNIGAGMTAVRRSVAKAKAMAAPIYTKTLGGATGVRDLRVELNRTRELAFVRQRVAVVVNLQTQGALAGKTRLTLRLNEEVIETRDVELLPHRGGEETFHVSQESSGLYRYEIAAEGLPGEVTGVNNRATLLLRVVDKPVRVLLLEGKPYWDTKFLIRMFAADESIELVSVVQLAEGRLLQRTITRKESTQSEVGDPAKESHTPDTHTQDTQPPDTQPLQDERWTIRKDAAEILADPEMLNSFQIVVLGRNADVFLTDEAMMRLEKWLKQREASLVCFRGAPSSQIGQRLGALMPVRWSTARESRFRVQMTEVGSDLHWLPTNDGQGGIAVLPSLAKVAQPQRREIAQTLAQTVADAAGNTDPVISYLRVGMGRVVVVEGAGMWRWAFLPPSYKQHDATYQTLWRSLTRWLVSNVQLLPSQRFALRTEKVSFNASEHATADLLIRAENLGQQVPEVTLGGTAFSKPKSFTPVPAGDSPGRYRIDFGRLPEGQYRAVVAGAGDNEVSAVAAFDVRRGNLNELLQVEAKPQQMKFIAEQSGGAILDSSDADAFAGQFDLHLSKSRPDRMSQTTAWDRWWVLIAAFSLWGVTWGIRRYSGLI